MDGPEVRNMKPLTLEDIDERMAVLERLLADQVRQGERMAAALVRAGEHRVIRVRPSSDAKLSQLWDYTSSELRALADAEPTFPMHVIGSGAASRYYVNVEEVDSWFVKNNHRKRAVRKNGGVAGEPVSIFADRRRSG